VYSPNGFLLSGSALRQDQGKLIASAKANLYNAWREVVRKVHLPPLWNLSIYFKNVETGSLFKKAT
jgi:hypothetical protein